MERTPIIRSLITGICIIVTGCILGHAFRNRNAGQDSISVTGLGTKNFLSDEILFSGSFSARSMDAKDAYAQISNQKTIVADFFKRKGFSAQEVVFSGITFDKQYRTMTTTDGEATKTEQVFDGYVASLSISIASKKNPELMKRIEAVSEQTSELINLGIEFNPSKIQYTYSDLSGLKYALIESASKDAYERSQKIVGKADGKLGKLKNASMGVFQITGTGEDVEDSYGGNYDIYSKEKVARITVRLQYELD